MRYKAMGQNRSRRLDVPQLCGGLNTRADAALIDDDELAAVCNLTWKNGALETRGAVRAIGDEPLYAQAGKNSLVNEILRQRIEIDGKPCVIIASCASDNTQNGEVTMQVVSLDGVCLHTYTMGIGQPPYTMSIIPCDKDLNGSAFLVYFRGGMYAPNNTTNVMEPVSEEKLYAPLVMVNGTSIQLEGNTTPSAGLANGVMYEGFNMLTRRYRAQFTPSVESGAEYYILPSKLQNEPLEMAITTVHGETNVSMTPGGDPVGFQVGAILYSAQAFTDGYVRVSPALPVSTISNTVTITCMGPKTVNAAAQYATLATWFGGTQNKRGGTRLFLAGFHNSTNVYDAKLMWSDVNDPFYFPENNYMYVGDLSQRITALEKQGDMLVIFKERELFYTTYVQGEIDVEAIIDGTNVDVTAAQAYFPLTQLSPSIGCRCPNSIALCRDRLVWMDSDARIYTLVITGAYSERNVREIGGKVRPFLLENTTEGQRRAASAIDHKGKYRVLIDKTMVEFDYSDSGFVNVSGYSSGERAARNIAWFVQRFNGFGDGARQVLVSDGADTALLISTAAFDGDPAYTIVRMLYAFDVDGENDRYVTFAKITYAGSLYTTVTEQPIAASLTTKTYELGDPAAFKRPEALLPSIETANATIRVIADGQASTDGRRYHSDGLYAHLVLPGVKRCRTFALQIDAQGKLRIKGLRLQYTLFGTVR